MKKDTTQSEGLRIPDNWEFGKLADFGVFRSGNGFPLAFQGHQSGDYPFFKVSDLSGKGNELFMQNANHYISEDVREKLKAIRFQPESIVFAHIGAAIFLERKRLLSQESCLDNNMMAFTLTDNLACPQFFYYLFLYTELGKLVSTTALPALSGSHIGALSVPIPPPIEQRAIAESLSGVDELLNALDALIAKKQAIKQATMQQLLAGKTRLPGFSGTWQEMRIGDLFDAKAGGDLVQSRYNDVQDNHFPYPIYANGLEQQGLYGFSDYAEEPAGSITVTARGTLGQAFYRDTPFVAIGRLLVLKPKNSLDARFFCEYINYGIHVAVESTGVPQLTAPQVSRYQLSVPTEPEQRAITAVLSDMDAEITALEQRRDKTSSIKQGMMQQLLTGQVRLVKPDTSANSAKSVD